MRSGVYLPVVNLKIERRRGERMLLAHLIRSGLPYRIVAHDTEPWKKLEYEGILYSEMIQIISEREHERYTEISEKFFAPLIEGIPSIGGIRYFTFSGSSEKIPVENLIFDLSRALFLLMIANKYKTRIYEGDFLRDALEWANRIERSRSHFPTEGVERVLKFKKLLEAYQSFDEQGFSVNMEYDIHKEFRKLLSDMEIQRLSEEKYNLGILGVKLDMLLFNIREKVTKFLESKAFPWLTETAFHLFLIQASTPSEFQLLGPTINLLSREVKLDLREYAPPIQRPQIYTLGKSWSFEPVNSKMTFFVPKR